MKLIFNLEDIVLDMVLAIKNTNVVSLFKNGHGYKGPRHISMLNRYYNLTERTLFYKLRTIIETPGIKERIAPEFTRFMLSSSPINVVIVCDLLAKQQGSGYIEFSSKYLVDVLREMKEKKPDQFKVTQDLAKAIGRSRQTMFWFREAELGKRAPLIRLVPAQSEAGASSEAGNRMNATDLFFVESKKSGGRLSPEEELRLIKEAQAGNVESKNRVVVAYLPLVVSIAKKYSTYSYSLLDLINEGSIGLMKAVIKYNSERGPFKACAGWYIWGSIMEVVTRDIPFRISTNQRLAYPRFTKVYDELLTKGIDPTVENVAKAAKIPKELALQLFMIREDRNITSLDHPVDEDGELLIDAVADPDPPTNPAEITHDMELVLKIWNRLSPRQRDILIGRLALEEKFRKIALRWGVGTSAIQRDENIALAKLRGALESPPVFRRYSQQN